MQAGYICLGVSPVDIQCELCGVLAVCVEWQQLSLDHSHRVEWLAQKCGCGWRVLDATVVDMSEAHGG